MNTILRSIALLCLVAHASAGELLTGEAAAANIAAEQLAELIAIQAAAGWELLFKTKLDFEGVAPAGIGEPPRGRAAALVFRKAK